MFGPAPADMHLSEDRFVPLLDRFGGCFVGFLEKQKGLVFVSAGFYPLVHRLSSLRYPSFVIIIVPPTFWRDMEKLCTISDKDEFNSGKSTSLTFDRSRSTWSGARNARWLFLEALHRHFSAQSKAKKDQAADEYTTSSSG